jgi:hypothetical protein
MGIHRIIDELSIIDKRWALTYLLCLAIVISSLIFGGYCLEKICRQEAEELPAIDTNGSAAK